MLRVTLLLSSFFLALALTGCQNKQAAKAIQVAGFVQHLPDGKVYLTDAYDWRIVYDSAIATNGHFAFKLAPDTAFVPFLASIHYPDSTRADWHYSRQLIYLNAYESRGKIVSGTSAFFLGPEGAVIKGSLLPATALLTVAAGKDNELYQQLSGNGFGYINTRNPANRPSRLRYFERLIQQHPASYFLLKSILNDKQHYTEKELQGLLGLFQQQVQSSRVGQDLRTYLANRTDATAPYPNLLLVGANQTPQRILAPHAKLNLLIFWASWCGPCRQEIPALKQVYQTFHRQGLHMTGISIDEDPRKWQQALGQEQMGWQQVVIPKNQLLRVKQQFNLSGVPLLILTDSLGHEISQKTGYSEQGMAALSKAIAVGLQ